MRRFACSLIVAALAAAAFTVPAAADTGGVKAGVLSCTVDSGWGFIFGSSRTLNCVYSAKAGMAENYVGRISKFGVDIGYLQSAVIVWAVVAPTTDLAPGALSGDYGGATAGVTVGVGAGANVLIGGSTRSIALQPISIEGNAGLNVAAGIAAINLELKK